MSNKKAKDNIAKTTTRVLSKAIKIVALYEDDEERNKIFVFNELSKVTSEVVSCIFNEIKSRVTHKNWNRMERYYEMLADIVTEGPYQTEYILKNFDMITDICDLVL